MSLGLLGKKLGMTHIYDENGKSIAVTVVDVSENDVMQVKTAATDGYNAVQIGFGNKRESRATKAAIGHAKKSGLTPNQFANGQWVDVIGTSKGHGFTGGMKRHNFSGQRQTHGSMMHRRTGAIGCRLTPGRVWKNQRMPGHMGVDRRTVQNLQIVGVRPEENIILVSGSIPGSKGGLVILRPAKKKPLAS